MLFPIFVHLLPLSIPSLISLFLSLTPLFPHPPTIPVYTKPEGKEMQNVRNKTLLILARRVDRRAVVHLFLRIAAAEVEG